MKNLFKKYFLFISRYCRDTHPMSVSFLAVIFFIGIGVLVNKALDFDTGLLIFIITLACIAHGVIYSIVLSKYITIPRVFEEIEKVKEIKADESCYEILVSPEGKAIYLDDEPVWGKGDVYILILKEDDSEIYENSETDEFDLSFIYPVNIRFNSYFLKVRFGIKVHFKEDPDPQELYEKILMNYDLSINEYFLEEFNLANNFSENEKQVFKLLADKFINGSISRQFFIDSIGEKITFPNNIFSAIKSYSFFSVDDNLVI
jgi:hypothetical protein